MKISPSGLSLFSTCRRAFYYRYIAEIERDAPRKRHFEKGTYAHSVMHQYFDILQAGIAPGSNIARSKLQSRFLADFAEVKDNPEATAIVRDVSSIMMMYLDSVSVDADARMNIVGIELYLTKELVLSNGAEVTLHGYADLIHTTLSGTLVVRDLKTGEDTRSWSQNKLTINVQLLCYLYLCRLLFPNVTNFRGDIMFLLTKFYKKEKAAEDRFKHLSVSYTAAELDTAFLELERLLVDASSLTEHNATMALDKDACAYCQYAPICDEKLRGKDTAVTIRNLYRKRDDSGQARPSSNPTITNQDPGRVTEDFTLHINF